MPGGPYSGQWCQAASLSVDSIEWSQSMTLDKNPNRLVISHPGDAYSSRHCINVADADNPGFGLFRIGDTGSGPGQFSSPTGGGR